MRQSDLHHSLLSYGPEQTFIRRCHPCTVGWLDWAEALARPPFPWWVLFCIMVVPPSVMLMYSMPIISSAYIRVSCLFESCVTARLLCVTQCDVYSALSRTALLACEAETGKKKLLRSNVLSPSQRTARPGCWSMLTRANSQVSAK